MKLCLSHRFRAPVTRVMRALSSADYASHLVAHHSFFDAIEVLARRESAGVVERSVRYRARPFIARLGIFSLPADWFSWVEHSRFDLTRGLLTFENVPEVQSVREKLTNRGSMKFQRELDAHGRELTLRASSFEIAFEVPALYRPLAELGLSRVARQLESSLAEEAGLLDAWLTLRAAQARAA